MSAAVCDTSVVVKWFADEQDSEAARQIARRAAERGDLRLHCLELTLYELGNVCVQAGEAAEVPRRLEHVMNQMSHIHVFDRSLAGAAAGLAAHHRLTFYDASHLALATVLNVPLITADRELLATGGVTAANFAAEL